MKTGIIGAGAISDIYLENMIRRFDALEVVSICAGHIESAQRGFSICRIRTISEAP